jgi:hypothetical protein
MINLFLEKLGALFAPLVMAFHADGAVAALGIIMAEHRLVRRPAIAVYRMAKLLMAFLAPFRLQADAAFFQAGIGFSRRFLKIRKSAPVS